MFYVCIATEENTPRVMYPEHFTEKIDRDKRALQLKFECYNHDGALWKLWGSDSEPFEAAMARSTAKPMESETVSAGDDQETIDSKVQAFQKRVDALALTASKASKSKLTAPEIDDVPQWFKDGFQNQADWELYQRELSS